VRRILSWKAVEDLLRQLDGGRAHRDGAARRCPGLATDALATAERLVEACRWRMRPRTRPISAPPRGVPALLQLGGPEVCGSPTTIESRLAATRKRCRPRHGRRGRVQATDQALGATPLLGARVMDGTPQPSASPDCPHARTSTRLHVRRSRPQSTAAQRHQSTSAGSSRPFANATRSRSSTQARCDARGPTRTAFSCAPGTSRLAVNAAEPSTLAPTRRTQSPRTPRS
jgi:hypothetical protein